MTRIEPKRCPATRRRCKCYLAVSHDGRHLCLDNGHDAYEWDDEPKESA